MTLDDMFGDDNVGERCSQCGVPGAESPLLPSRVGGELVCADCEFEREKLARREPWSDDGVGMGDGDD